MWETGQKTKRCYFWMSEGDIARFSQMLAQVRAGHWFLKTNGPVVRLDSEAL